MYVGFKPQISIANASLCAILCNVLCWCACLNMWVVVTQMGLDIPDALGVIGKTHTLLLSGCPIAFSQLVCVNVVTNYHSTTAWPRDESLAATLYISNLNCSMGI